MREAKLQRLVAAVAIAVGAIACGRAIGSPGVELPLRALGDGTMSGVTDELRAVYRDDAAWSAFWARHAPARPRPAVAFDQAMVVAVVLPRNTGGFSVALDGAMVADGRLVVRYTEVRPGPDAVTIQVLTQPWACAEVPRRDEPADFVARVVEAP